MNSVYVMLKWHDCCQQLPWKGQRPHETRVWSQVIQSFQVIVVVPCDQTFSISIRISNFTGVLRQPQAGHSVLVWDVWKDPVPETNLPLRIRDELQFQLIQSGKKKEVVLSCDGLQAHFLFYCNILYKLISHFRWVIEWAAEILQNVFLIFISVKY